MNKCFKNFLTVDKEQQLLQSFIRIETQTDDESPEDWSANKISEQRGDFSLRKVKSGFNVDKRKKSAKCDGILNNIEKTGTSNANRGARIETELKEARKKIEDQVVKKRKPKENFVDFYTDKDRAAAVSAGTYDIKQSLQIKQRQDRNEALLIPEEADVSSLIALGLKEIKNANPENAINFFSKALEFNNVDVNALVSRSKCYLLLGEPYKALHDAETALKEDKNNIRAIYQKAESLYYLGQFEQSLMYFHRGLRVRPELSSFRLGVQKTRQAIENTISMNQKQGRCGVKVKSLMQKKPQISSNHVVHCKVKLTKEDLERKNARKLLDKLSIDKEYLENLLKHPNLKRADTNTENISSYAREAVNFLDKRQEFWRQQRPCVALQNHKAFPPGSMPKWF
uniref:Outer dynein arm-docking complex subunit 4 n=1 Tax=Glossina brevipalpis TaxID=37001 RepID=A0A1A9WXJ9_9MUSC